MTRPLLAWLAVLGLIAPAARAQGPEHAQRTGRMLAALQNADGGFAGKEGGPSSLGTTSSVIRTLMNVGGSIPDVFKAIAYVKSCRDADSGGFAPTPGGKPDVNTTASGLMALPELKIDDAETIRKAVAFLTESAKSYEEIRIAVAGLEAVNAKSDAFGRWTEQINGDRKADGTWGEVPSRAFDTGGRAVALLRMGVSLDKTDAILAAMRDGQRDDGGWSPDGNESTLSATYRVMRGFFMMKERPKMEALKSYLARHRVESGGYSLTPGGPFDPGATYYGTTVNRWARLLDGEPALVETAAYRPLFDGKSLDGWEGDTSLWSARDGMLVGTSPGLKHNDFLATKGSFGDFALKFTFQLVDGRGNSGVQFRSVRVPGHEMSGYQADIGEKFWGCLYDESRRNKVLVEASDRAKQSIRPDGWNQYGIRALGDKITLTFNGVTSVDYTEPESTIARDGKIAVQIHAGGPMEVRFRDMYIQPLPSPKEDGGTEPGFHLRTAKTSAGERKYTIYLPQGYDGSKPMPAALFLHGSGERGEDGVRSAQVGLGAAIMANPSAYPLIVIFPQARQTWRADSDDAKAALEILDQCQKELKIDPDRVALTGLSMGGSGSWSIATAHPDRFAAVVPVCGAGDPKAADTLKSLPAWTLLGDADSDRVVRGSRAMVEAIRAAGGTARETEYRGVGHNSWDRAYSDPQVIRFLTAHARGAGQAGPAK